MCIAPRIGRTNSLYDLPQTEKLQMQQKLPFLSKKRLKKIVKNILHQFLDNLADFIFLNGKIYTMNQKQEVVQAVAVKGDEIIFAGKESQAIVYRGQMTKIVDLQGRVMFPGFVDPHVHMCFTMFRHWLDLSPFVNDNMDAVKKRLNEHLQEIKQKPHQWVTGQLYDPTVTEGQFDVSKEALDKICKENPLFILQANGHVAHVNSMALKVAGITKDSEDPPHGRFVRNSDGQLTGELQQSAVIMFKKYLLGSASSYLQNFKAFLDHCSSKGCTTLHDCGIGIVDPKADISVLLETIGDQSPVRYSGYLVSTQWKVWMQQKMQPDFKDPLLRINGVKCWADGSAQGGSAFMRQPYKKKQWGQGKPNYTLEKLTQSIKVAHDKGWQVGVHANGDAGIDLTLDAFEAVQKQNPNPNLRHRIEHCTVCHPEQLQRMKQLNVYPSFLIGHVYYYGHVFRDLALGQKRGNLVDPMKTALKCELRPTMHSDYNCQPVDPIRCLYNAVTRKMKANGQVLNKDECLTPYQALRALTIDSAWQCHFDDITGSIEVGKKADFVVLNKNPMEIPHQQLLHLKVVQTWMGGQRRFKSEQFNFLTTAPSLNSNYSFQSKSSLSSVQSIEEKFSCLETDEKIEEVSNLEEIKETEQDKKIENTEDVQNADKEVKEVEKAQKIEKDEKVEKEVKETEKAENAEQVEKEQTKISKCDKQLDKKENEDKKIENKQSQSTEEKKKNE